MTVTKENLDFIWSQISSLFLRKNSVEQELTTSENPVSSAAVKAAIDKLSGTPIVPKGSVEFASLPAIADAEVGDLYNIKDNFTTTDDFIEGAGVKISAGTNIVCVADGETKKWDCFGTNFEVDSEAKQNSNNPISSDAVYQLKEIVNELPKGSMLTHKGVLDSIDKLPSLSDCEVGDFYTITVAEDSVIDGHAGQTTSDFVEGVQYFPQDARIICVLKDGEKKWTRLDTYSNLVNYVDKYTSTAAPTAQAVAREISLLENNLTELIETETSGFMPLQGMGEPQDLSLYTKTGIYTLGHESVEPEPPSWAYDEGNHIVTLLVFNTGVFNGSDQISQIIIWGGRGITTRMAYRHFSAGSGKNIQWTIVNNEDMTVAAAKALSEPRKIAGTSFDGSKDIDISYENLTNKPTIPTVSNDLTDELKTQYDNAAATAHTHDNKEVLDKITEPFTAELKEKVETPYLPLAGGTMTGTVSTAVANFIISSANKYKVFFRNDGSSFYILQSDADGDSWNTKRPFVLNFATGEASINGAAATLVDSGWIDMTLNPDFVTSGTIKYRAYGKQLMIYGENVVLAKDLVISPPVPQMLASTDKIDFSKIKCCSGIGRSAKGGAAYFHALQYIDGTNMISAEAIASVSLAGDNLYFTITGLID